MARSLFWPLRGAFLWHYLSGFESTDDAQVDVHLYPVSARISGYVQKVNVEDNQWVDEGSTLVEIDPKDYEVALARAQATLDTSRGCREKFEYRCADIFRRYLKPIEIHLLGYQERAKRRSRQQKNKPPPPTPAFWKRKRKM